jgi:uncharacterized protein YpmS
MKIPKPQKTAKQIKKKINLEKFIPYIVLLSFLIMGAVIISFGYFIFNREPEKAVVSGARQELDEISIKFDKDKIEKLFDSSYSTAEVNEPPFQPKNPFTGF